jgi:hypothetical protein
VTEEQADEMIVFAEGAAEQVEEENRLAREAAAKAEAAAAEAGELQPEAAEAPAEAAAEESKPEPTLETLFGPDVTVRSQEEKLDPAQVFGDAPAAPKPSETESPPSEQGQPT